MNLETATSFLCWSLILNYSILMTWFLAIVVGKGWVFKFHSRWFPMPKENYVRIHYTLMGVYKLGIFLFNLVPLLALLIIR
jgi:hypothetical protein